MGKLIDAIRDWLDELLPRPEPEPIRIPVRVNDRPRRR
jgi:hypothetical protein